MKRKSNKTRKAGMTDELCRLLGTTSTASVKTEAESSQYQSVIDTFFNPVTKALFKETGGDMNAYIASAAAVFCTLHELDAERVTKKVWEQVHTSFDPGRFKYHYNGNIQDMVAISAVFLSELYGMSYRSIDIFLLKALIRHTKTNE